MPIEVWPILIEDVAGSVESMRGAFKTNSSISEAEATLELIKAQFRISAKAQDDKATPPVSRIGSFHAVWKTIAAHTATSILIPDGADLFHHYLDDPLIQHDVLEGISPGIHLA